MLKSKVALFVRAKVTGEQVDFSSQENFGGGTGAGLGSLAGGVAGGMLGGVLGKSDVATRAGALVGNIGGAVYGAKLSGADSKHQNRAGIGAFLGGPLGAAIGGHDWSKGKGGDIGTKTSRDKRESVYEDQFYVVEYDEDGPTLSSKGFDTRHEAKIEADKMLRTGNDKIHVMKGSSLTDKFPKVFKSR